MQLLRALYDWGFLDNKTVNVDGAEVGVMDAIASYLLQSEQGTTTQLYGYALHVEVSGTENGQPICYTYKYPSGFRWIGFRLGKTSSLYSLCRYPDVDCRPDDI